jgi:hypothetical protein
MRGVKYHNEPAQNLTSGWPAGTIALPLCVLSPCRARGVAVFGPQCDQKSLEVVDEETARGPMKWTDHPYWSHVLTPDADRGMIMSSVYSPRYAHIVDQVQTADWTTSSAVGLSVAGKNVTWDDCGSRTAMGRGFRYVTWGDHATALQEMFTPGSSGLGECRVWGMTKEVQGQEGGNSADLPAATSRSKERERL